MNKVDLGNEIYRIRNSRSFESEKIERVRELACQEVEETKEPYVVVHWSEHPKIKGIDIKKFNSFNLYLSSLNMDEERDGGYYKTKLDILYFHDGEVNCYGLRYDIGADSYDLISHIKDNLKISQFFSDNEKEFMKKTLNCLEAV